MTRRTSPKPRHRAPDTRWFRGRLLPVTAVVSGCLLLGVTLYTLLMSKPVPENFGAVERETTVAESATLMVARPASSSARMSMVPVTVSGPPAWLDLPAIHVHARVENVVTTDGILGVPDDPATVGWWTGSALPGSQVGSTVLDGHVDSAVSGAGALFFLTRLAAGDPVSIVTTNARIVHYRVTARRTYAKHAPLPPDLFAAAGSPRLVLITCGGRFDATARSYEDNIVVFAVPVE